MRKFDDQDQQGASPGGSEPIIRLAAPRPAARVCSASSEGLKALVGFAIGRGYYERWNNPAELGVTPCKSKVFPTDKGGDSR
jgi:hypothetical protein